MQPVLLFDAVWLKMLIPSSASILKSQVLNNQSSIACILRTWKVVVKVSCLDLTEVGVWVVEPPTGTVMKRSETL